ncbi:MAG: dATP/dGTP pyrophosphohydrolase domain-containing protein [Phyllobacterium sp.]
MNELVALQAENAKLRQAARDRVKTFAAERKKLNSRFDLIKHLQRQAAFSHRTFGPGPRTLGNLDHIRKELLEIERDPDDLKEWVDVMLLAFDGAMRRGFSPDAIVATLETVLTRNESRTWPDWRTMPDDRAIEHDRSNEEVQS